MFKQLIRLLALLTRRPILFARANLRLITRGLHYLAQNPDLAWARELLNPSESGPLGDSLILISDKGIPIFSLLIANGKIKTLPAQALRAFIELDSFRENIEADFKMPLQTVLINAEIFSRINFKLATEKNLDAFFLAGREILGALAQGMIKFSPLIPDAEMLASLDGEELLSKFGPRFGVGMDVRVRLRTILAGLLLALLSPLTRWRMKKNFDTLSD